MKSENTEFEGDNILGGHYAVCGVRGLYEIISSVGILLHKP
jgi:hypothetical protein